MTVVAYTYPLLDIFWTMLWIFLFILWIYLLIVIFGDIFRSRDMGGGAKALWTVFIIVIPFIGILAYLIFRGGGMRERAVERAQEQRESLDAYVRETAASSNTSADEIAKLADLRSKGVLTEEEFQSQKAKLLH